MQVPRKKNKNLKASQLLPPRSQADVSSGVIFLDARLQVTATQRPASDAPRPPQAPKILLDSRARPPNPFGPARALGAPPNTEAIA